MAFEKTPRGTYGQKIPAFAGPLMKMMLPLMRWQVRRRGHSAGINLVVLTTIGAKSGQRRQTILGALPDGDGAWLIAASAGGAAANPAWYHNLAGHPDQAELIVGHDSYAVTATQLTGAQRDAAWEKIVAAGPRYAGYVPKTDRLIPILRLAATG
jgi:deazaflavin-dependent oxidoreductase (nitroreductase family)